MHMARTIRAVQKISRRVKSSIVSVAKSGRHSRLCSEPSGRGSRGGPEARNARRRPFASTAERRVGDGVEVHGREQSHVSKGGL